jgi:AbrB family looped-hinge helix DNA binding protein
MAITRKVNKLNRSLSVVIPKEVLATTGIKAGDELSFAVNDDKSITLRPVVREQDGDEQMVKRYADLYQQLKPAMDYLREK